MLVETNTYFEEDIESLPVIDLPKSSCSYGRNLRGRPPKIISNSAKGGLVKSYRKYPLWSKRQQKIIDKVDEVLKRWP
jgi:hypothetical protein